MLVRKYTKYILTDVYLHVWSPRIKHTHIQRMWISFLIHTTIYSLLQTCFSFYPLLYSTNKGHSPSPTPSVCPFMKLPWSNPSPLHSYALGNMDAVKYESAEGVSHLFFVRPLLQLWISHISLPNSPFHRWSIQFNKTSSKGRCSHLNNRSQELQSICRQNRNFLNPFWLFVSAKLL